MSRASHGQGEYSLHYARSLGPVEWTVLAWVFDGGIGPIPSVFESRAAEFQKTAADVRDAIKDLGLPEPTLESVMEIGAELGLRRGLPPFVAPGDSSVARPGTPPVAEYRRGARGFNSRTLQL